MSEPKNVDEVYKYVLKKVSSPEFRNQIKDFIDQNCTNFLDIEENTFEQGGLFNEFTMLIDNLLEKLCKESKITEEMFLLAAKKGLEDDKNKKYFEQLIAFNNFNYFKAMMTKRNYQIIAMVEKEMEKEREKNKKINAKKEEKKLSDKEMQQAIKMSLALEDEKRRIAAIEEEDLKRAIKLSILEAQNKNLPKPVENVNLNNNNKKNDNNINKKNEGVNNNNKNENNFNKKNETVGKNDNNNNKKNENIKKNDNINNNNKKIENKSNIGNVNINLSSNLNVKEEGLNSNVKKEAKFESSGKGFGSQINALNSQFGINENINKNTPTPKPKTYKDINVKEKIENKDNNIDNNEDNNAFPITKSQNEEIKKYEGHDPVYPFFQKKRDNPLESINPNKKYTNVENKNYEFVTPNKNYEVYENITSENPTPNPNTKDIPITKKKDENLIQTIQVEKYKEKKEEEDVKIENNNNIIKNEDPIFDSLLDDDNDDKKNVNMGNANINFGKKENINKEPIKENAASLIKKSLENNAMRNPNEPIKNSFFDKSDKLNPIKKKQGDFISGMYNQSNYTKSNYSELEDKFSNKKVSVIEKKDANHELEKKTDEIEKERIEKMKQYREMILKMKREERKKKEIEYINEEEKKRLEARKELAEKLISGKK